MMCEVYRFLCARGVSGNEWQKRPLGLGFAVLLQHFSTVVGSCGRLLRLFVCLGLMEQLSVFGQIALAQHFLLLFLDAYSTVGRLSE